MLRIPGRGKGAFDAGAALERLERALDHRRLRKLAHADRNDLGGGHPQCHLVLDEIDEEELQLGARHLLLLDGDDLPDPVGWIDDKSLVLKPWRCVHFLGHPRNHSLPWLATAERFGDGSRTARTAQ